MCFTHTRFLPTGCSDNVSPGAERHKTCHLQTETSSGPDTKVKTSVTFKHNPEFFNNEVSLQDSSQAESTQASQENASCGLPMLATEEKKKTNFEKHDEAEEEDKDSGVRGKGISA